MIGRVRRLLESGDKRSVLIKKNIVFSILIKGWSALVVFLMVPLVLSCVGTYKNGIWLTISSLLVWIDNFDIGLGNGLRNVIASSVAKEDKTEAREAVSSTFAMLAIIIIPICVLLCFIVSNVNVYSILNVDDNTVPDLVNVILVCLIFVSCSFILKFIGNVYLGLQLPAMNNMLQALSQTIALGLTFLVYLAGTHSLLHIALANTAAPFLAYLAFYPYTFYVRYRYLRPSVRLIKIKVIHKLLSTGVLFFVIQISGILLFMSSNILISRMFSPEYVTPFQIAYRYFYIPLLLFTIIGTPYWSATTDAYVRGDIQWIRESNKKLGKAVAFMVLIVMVMVLVSKPFYHIWVGTDVEIPFRVTLMMAFYISVTIASLRYSFLLNGLGALRLQLFTTLSAALLFIPMSIIVVDSTGSLAGFVAVLCIVNVPGLVLNKIQYDKIIAKTAKGIWKV